MNFIDQIKTVKKHELADKKKNHSDFLQKVTAPSAGDIGFIAEIKLATPSNGTLGDRNEVLQRIRRYEQGGADALSVVVDKSYFNGDMGLLLQISQSTTLPILCKDFIIDEYQIYEAKIHCADAVLLIAGLLNAEKLKAFVKLIMSLGMEPVVEFSQKNELKKVLGSGARAIAVNARNFTDLSIDLDRAYRLLELVPDKFVKLGFSGIKSHADVVKYKKAGATGVLVGTRLMRAKKPDELIRIIKGV